MFKRSHAREAAHRVVETTGNDYAYQFVRARNGLLEVRVLPGGRTLYTPCDLNGRPTGTPRTGFVRAGGWRANTLLLGLIAPAGAVVAALTGVLF